jgi:FMN reductase
VTASAVDRAVNDADSAAAGGRDAPLILGLGGTLRAGSSSELALRHALAAVERAGARTRLITAMELDLPMYNPDRPLAAAAAAELVDAARRADGLIVATPGYHGGMSGLVKNALDYLQELAEDPSPYLHGKAVGCIVTSAGGQAGTTTLAALRSIVHALRGWPTPLGVVASSAELASEPSGRIADARVRSQLDALSEQVVTFARNQR